MSLTCRGSRSAGFTGKRVGLGGGVILLLILGASGTSYGQFGPVVQQIGGVWIDPSGVIQHQNDAQRDEALDWLRQNLQPVPGAMQQVGDLRAVSLKGLEAALRESAESGQPLADEVKYLAGIQRLQYVLVEPASNDIWLVGPGEPWAADEQGNIVGASSRRPVCRLEDLVAAMRTALQANQDYGISVSIQPSEEGINRLHSLYRKAGFSPDMADDVERAVGPQQISLTGVPTDSRFAQILVAADYRMKRLAMGFDRAPIQGMPSVLEMAVDRGQGANMSPRFWMECSYEPLHRSQDGLTWQLAGPGVKTLTEEDHLVGVDGQVKKAHPIAQEWAARMTEKFEELAAADPIFGELRNLMDMAVIAALIEKEQLLSRANLDLPLIREADSPARLTQWNVPRTVATQCSFVRVENDWLVTASGGVQVDSWRVADTTKVDERVTEIRRKFTLADGKNWWTLAAK